MRSFCRHVCCMAARSIGSRPTVDWRSPFLSFVETRSTQLSSLQRKNRRQVRGWRSGHRRLARPLEFGDPFKPFNPLGALPSVLTHAYILHCAMTCGGEGRVPPARRRVQQASSSFNPHPAQRSGVTVLFEHLIVLSVAIGLSEPRASVPDAPSSSGRLFTEI